MKEAIDKERILDRLRVPLPPKENLGLINVSTKDLVKAYKYILNDIKLMRSLKTVKLVCLVGPRGIGKTHLNQAFIQLFGSRDEINNVIFHSIDMERSPILIAKALVRELGRNFFINLCEDIRSNLNENDDIKLLRILSTIINNDLLSLALIRLHYQEEQDLIWRWLSSRIGLREINIVKIGMIRISRNLNDEDAIIFLESLLNIINYCYQTNPAIFIDEAAYLLGYKPSERKRLKRFLVDIINHDWHQGIFIGLSCTPDVWTDLAEERYSESVGLARRLRKIDLFGFASIDEAHDIADKILALYDPKLVKKINESIDLAEEIATFYQESNRNPGTFINLFVRECDHFYYENDFESPKIEESLDTFIQNLEEKGKKES